MSSDRCDRCGDLLDARASSRLCSKCQPYEDETVNVAAHRGDTDELAIIESKPPVDRIATAEDEGVLRQFGDYDLLAEVARGGMGVVYKARQRKLNRTVALKMILSGQLASEQEVRRFHVEAEAAAILDHPAIVPIYEVGESNGQHFFSMGFVDGQSLADKVAEGPLAPREAAQLTKKVVEAIAYAHSRGVIHRDLKPANVLLDGHGEPRVTDFGVAKNSVADSSLTASGQILGTPAYMPPEQAAGQHDRVNESADVYSLGAMLYTLVTGRPPFQADNHFDTLVQVLEKEVAPPSLLNPKVDRDLETICLKCLDKDPHRRYASAQALADDLGRYIEGESISVKSFNVLDRVARSLQRSRYDVDLHAWGSMLYWFAAIVLLSEIGIYFHALGGPPYPRHWAGLIRGGQAAAMGLVLWKQREVWSVSTGSAERQMLALWIGFVVACNLVLAVAYLLSSPERPLDELRIYPHFAIISGLTYFVMGSSYWGKCYLFAIGFFALALVMPVNLSLAPLEFGSLWALCLVLIVKRLQALADSCSAAKRK